MNATPTSGAKGRRWEDEELRFQRCRHAHEHWFVNMTAPGIYLTAQADRPAAILLG